MQEEKLIAFIEESFHPDPYPELVEGCTETKKLFLLHHTRSVRLLFYYTASARYALAVAPWKTESSPKDQMNQIRSGVRRVLKASYLRGVGLIILWYGEEKSWRRALDCIAPDLHGLRSTIIQGLVFLDPSSGVSEILQSSWGPVKFGDYQGQLTKIRAFCSPKQTYHQKIHSDATSHRE